MIRNFLKRNCHKDDSQRINKYYSIPDIIFDSNSDEMDKIKKVTQNYMENTSTFLVLLFKEMEARTRYVRPLYETFRKLFSTHSIIGLPKKSFRNEHLTNN